RGRGAAWCPNGGLDPGGVRAGVSKRQSDRPRRGRGWRGPARRAGASSPRRRCADSTVAMIAPVLLLTAALAQAPAPPARATGSPATIAERTTGLRRREGFIPFY